jgi:predicted nucleic acid-binding protein
VILVDANVLVYAVSNSANHAALAADFLSWAAGRGLCATPRTLEEFAHVNARLSRDREQARRYCVDFATTLGPLEHASEEDLAAALDLWATSSRLDFADAILAAQAKRLDATLISADKAFGEVPDLKWIDLADPELLERVQAAT